MDKEKIFIIWSWWHAKVVIDIIEENNIYEITWIIDLYSDKEKFLWYMLINKIDNLDVLLNWENKVNIFLAIWENYIREKEYLYLISKFQKISFPNIIHKSSMISKKTTLWKWIFIWPWVIINSHSVIWDFTLINTKATIDHDSIIWTFSSIWPWVTMGWWITLWSYSHIWLWANILEKINIWKHSLIWAGSLINKNVPDNVVVYWIPWKVIRNKSEWEKIYK